MPRRVFFSFHFANDFWRTQQVRNINALEGQAVCSANDWEEVKRKGDSSVKSWIANQMDGKSCVVVLVGSETASRPWVRHEIVKGWNDKRGVLGIRIHKLLGSDSKSCLPGLNPFEQIKFPNSTNTLANHIRLIDPAGTDSKAVYGSISANIESWIEDAIKARA